MAYVGIALTILVIVHNHTILKRQVTLAGSMPAEPGDKLPVVRGLLVEPWTPR